MQVMQSGDRWQWLPASRHVYAAAKALLRAATIAKPAFALSPQARGDAAAAGAAPLGAAGTEGGGTSASDSPAAASAGSCPRARRHTRHELRSLKC